MPVPTNFAAQLEAFVQEWKAAQASSSDWAYRGGDPFPHFVWTDPGDSWQACLDWLNELQGSWCFRGQRESSWNLDTSLDRAVLVARRDGSYHLNRQAEEQEMLFHFRQQAHLHVRHVPAADDLASWLAMMQHYGVPTRLLDWTTSPYVALYFSLVDEPSETHAALWALDLAWLNSRETHDALAGLEQMNQLLHATDRFVIVRIEPSMTSDRMAAQQGLLLAKGIPEATFSQMLISMMSHPEVVNRPVVRRLEVDKSLRTEVLQRLRDMNIHSASLFPGLDGFARFLKVGLEIKTRLAAAAASTTGWRPAASGVMHDSPEPRP